MTPYSRTLLVVLSAALPVALLGLLAVPAPVSMVTSAPNAFSFLTVSGVAATRVSCGRRSLTIAIFMERF